jgi:cytosine/adenosine deaminase-related metal-dependent hydrolase
MRLTLFRAAWVLPVAGPPVRDGAVLVDEAGRIAAVGPRAAIEPPEEAEVVELEEAALLPGLVNVHAHPELAAFRGFLEDLPFRDWILRLVGAKRAALVDADYDAAARWTMVEALRAGITTLAATEMSGAALDALREAGMRGIVFREVFGPDPAQADASMTDLREAVERMRERETERVRVGVSPHAPYTVSDPLFAAAAEFALAEGLPIAIHAAESAAERALVVEGEGDFAPGLRARGIATPARGRSTVEMLGRLGVLRARPLLIHCVDLDEDDVRRLADTGSAVAHCPVANARLGHGVARPDLHRPALQHGDGGSGGRELRTERDEAAGDRTGFGGRRYAHVPARQPQLPDVRSTTTWSSWRRGSRRRTGCSRITGACTSTSTIREVHYCKVLLDGIFGRECFLNEIIWAYDYGGRGSGGSWPAKHDNILVYVKDPAVHVFDTRRRSSGSRTWRRGWWGRRRRRAASSRRTPGGTPSCRPTAGSGPATRRRSRSASSGGS